MSESIRKEPDNWAESLGGACGAALESVLTAIFCRTPAEHISILTACYTDHINQYR